jgi:hypothetical protein
MNKKEKLKQFNNQLSYIVLNSAKKVGLIEEIIPQIKKCAEILGVEVNDDLDEINRKQQKKGLENEKENSAVNMAELPMAYTDAEQSKKPELIESILRECEILKKTGITGSK